VQHDAIVKRNQLLPHVVMAAAAEQRRMHALDLMKLQGKNEGELHAALAFKADAAASIATSPDPSCLSVERDEALILTLGAGL